MRIAALFKFDGPPTCVKIQIVNQTKPYHLSGATHLGTPTIIRNKNKSKPEREYSFQSCKNIITTN